MMPATPVSEMPADAVLTTDLGAHFDDMPQFAMTEIAPDMDLRPGAVMTTEMGAKFDVSQLSTTEMAADFGQLPTLDGPDAAPDFDAFAAVTGSTPGFAATAEMAPHFGRPPPVHVGGAHSADGQTIHMPAARSVLMPATRPILDQSTQELAGDFLTGSRNQDPMDQLGSDMFPPITLADATIAPSPPHDGTGAGGRSGSPGYAVPLPVLDMPDESEYESTQLLDPRSFAAQPPPFDLAGDPDDEPYESTMALGSTNYAAPPPELEPDFKIPSGRSVAARPAVPGPHEVKVEFGSAHEDPDRTIEIDGGFPSLESESEAADEDLFPPLK